MLFVPLLQFSAHEQHFYPSPHQQPPSIDTTITNHKPLQQPRSQLFLSPQITNHTETNIKPPKPYFQIEKKPKNQFIDILVIMKRR